MRVQIRWNPHDGTFWYIEISDHRNTVKCSIEEFHELKRKLEELEQNLKDEGLS